MFLNILGEALFDCVFSDGVDKFLIPEIAIDFGDVWMIDVRSSLDFCNDCFFESKLLNFPFLNCLQGTEEADSLLANQVSDAIIPFS